jgi:hypothetical protein
VLSFPLIWVQTFCIDVCKRSWMKKRLNNQNGAVRFGLERGR